MHELIPYLLQSLCGDEATLVAVHRLKTPLQGTQQPLGHRLLVHRPELYTGGQIGESIQIIAMFCQESASSNIDKMGI